MFPRVEPSSTGRLDVDGTHEIYWEESGRSDGIPVVYLHGGPGSGLGAGGYRTRFDPDRFRLIGLDQRGCGRSTPLATSSGYDLPVNTTRHLVADLEKLREHRGVDRWLVNGASWGSTLALAYAQAYPERVLGVVIMAVTSGSRFELDWITETVGALYPEAWDRVATHAERAGIGYRRGEGRLVDAYARLLTDPDPDVRKAAAVAWQDWEDNHVAIGAGGVQHTVDDDGGAQRLLSATLVTHYWSHDCFVTPPVLERMDRLAGIPATLIHGRLDVSSPAATAWQLHRAWPGSELIVVEDEGHGGAVMLQAWCDANSRHADRLAAPPVEH